MSASREPDISDIHSTTVAETFSVSSSDSSVIVHPIEVSGVTLSSVDVSVPQPLTVNVTVPNDPVQSPISNVVGASISVGADGPSVGAMADRASSAFLSAASNSLNLTEILNAQQQALEQFQCQLQLAQQTEAINQRLEAVERTLSSLIQQKAQEDAAKSSNHHHHHHHSRHHQSQPSPPSPPPPQQPEVDDLDVQTQVQLTAALNSTPLQSQQLQLTTPESIETASSEKRTKLPRELCSKVRTSYHSLNLEFKIDERFLSPANQRVTDMLIDHVFSDTNGLYTIKDIKRSAHRYYESRRRLGIEDLPDRQMKAAEQRKRRKYRARQQRTYDRRKKFVRESEMKYWEHVTPGCMTEESDSENGEKIVTHQLLWRSEFMNQFLVKLDSRYDKTKKPGTVSTVKRERVSGLASTSVPPGSIPPWMVDPSYKSSPSMAAVCMRESSLEPMQEHSVVADDVASYTALIGEVQDDSSDFELPEAVVS